MKKARSLQRDAGARLLARRRVGRRRQRRVEIAALALRSTARRAVSKRRLAEIASASSAPTMAWRAPEMAMEWASAVPAQVGVDQRHLRARP